MADLADTIDDLICSFESDGSKTMDTLIMYLFCWALVGFAALAVGKFAYGRVALYTGRKSAARTAAAPGTETDAAGAASDRKPSQLNHRVVPPTPPVARKRLGSKTGRTSAAVAGVAAGLSAVPAAAAASKAFSSEQQQAAHHLHHHHPQHQRRPPPAATGNDPDAVRWTNDVFKWLYDAAATTAGGDGEPSAVDYLLGEWTSALNEYTKKSFAEVSPNIFTLSRDTYNRKRAKFTIEIYTEMKNISSRPIITIDLTSVFCSLGFLGMRWLSFRWHWPW